MNYINEAKARLLKSLRGPSIDNEVTSSSTADNAEITQENDTTSVNELPYENIKIECDKKIISAQ